MQVMQNVARKYGLVCLLHEKPFAGVNGSGKHNNWSMGTDTGHNLMEPGETPAENINFLFFCTAVIQAVNKHQGLLRASVANIGQDHRLGANEAPPAIISIFLGAELDKVFESIASGEGRRQHRGRDARPRHAGAAAAADARRRPQPDLAVRLHRQQVRVPRARVEHVARLPEHGPEHDRRRGDRRARRQGREAGRGSGESIEDAVREVVKESYGANKQIVFGGDNYDEAWHAEAEKRGLKNLRTTPDALPEVLAPATIAAFGNYDGALRARARVALRGLARAVHRQREHRGRDGRGDRARR